MKTYSAHSKICHYCVGEAYLSAEIARLGKRGKCAFCGEVTRTYTLQQLTDRVEQVVLDHYERTPDQPSDWEYYKQFADKESDYHWYREGQTLSDLLINEFEINKDAAAEIDSALCSKYDDFDAQAAGMETEFGYEVQYETRGISDERWAKEWRRFEQTLKSEARFFSERVSEMLRSIFDGLDRFKTWSGKPVLTSIGPGKGIDCLYRARVFQSRDKLLEALCRPDVLLGPPAPAHAMSGRMNARGIAVFYGATEEPVAMAEVRPPVGSKVAVARFDLTRPLQLLDLRELSNVRAMVSVFDPQYLEKMEKAIFLRRLGEILTAPVMPDDEMFDYLPTQAIADYLASQADTVYDGIIYPSVQVAGEKINVVLFHKSARVAPIEISPGTKLEASDEEYGEDDFYESYKVIELVPARKKKPAGNPEPDTSSADSRIPALRIAFDSIYVHHVRSVHYETEAHPVSHHKTRKQKPAKPPDLDF